MAIYIHFFRESSLEKLDFAKVLDFFENLPNFKIYYTDDEVQIDYRDDDFKFSYRYLITKKSRVSQIYKLNRNSSTSISFWCGADSVVFGQRSDDPRRCANLRPRYLQQRFEDVSRSISLTSSLFEESRRRMIEYGMQEKLPTKVGRHLSLPALNRSLREYHNDVDVNPVERSLIQTKDYGISYTWSRQPAVFPYLDFVYIRKTEPPLPRPARDSAGS